MGPCRVPSRVRVSEGPKALPDGAVLSDSTECVLRGGVSPFNLFLKSHPTS